jgi:hypothetical protein
LIWGATLGRNFYVNIGRAAWEACSATWNLGTNSAFALGPRKITENLDRVGWSQDLPNAYWLLASSPAFKYTSPNGSPKLCYCFVWYLNRLHRFIIYIYIYIYIYILWISNEQFG